MLPSNSLFNPKSYILVSLVEKLHFAFQKPLNPWSVFSEEWEFMKTKNSPHIFILKIEWMNGKQKAQIYKKSTL